MNFDLTEDHVMMRKMVRDFAEAEVQPVRKKETSMKVSCGALEKMRAIRLSWDHLSGKEYGGWEQLSCPME